MVKMWRFERRERLPWQALIVADISVGLTFGEFLEDGLKIGYDA